MDNQILTFGDNAWWVSCDQAWRLHPDGTLEPMEEYPQEVYQMMEQLKRTMGDFGPESSSWTVEVPNGHNHA
ncbi:MAG: hypothetical protein J3T61_03270 [Candidatus Brocadiales bacterium]|nr:hypothetical protein [Candidatus Bathyanammoxibius sp.]